MTTLLLLLLAGCTPDYTKPAVPPAPAYTDPGLDTTGAGPVHRLAPDEGSYDLPDDSRPGHEAIKTEWVLEMTHESGNQYTARLPFEVGKSRGFPPPGVSVQVNGQPVKFGGRGGQRWHAERRTLEVRWPSAPNEVVVRNPTLASSIERLSFAESGLSHEDFVSWTVAHGGETREGLLLPAPATAEWTLTVPEKDPTFRSWVSMDHTPLPDDISDGAVAVLEVVEGDAVSEVGRQSIAGQPSSFTKFEADLDAWAGKEVTVRLRSDPGGSADHDYVFWGSPTVWGAAEGEVRRIVVIGIDTTRPDHFGFNGYDKPTSPELDALAANSVLFDKAWTPAPRTRPSFRSATTGRYPLDAVGSQTIGSVFKEHGFTTAGVVANVHLQPRFGFNEGFDRWVYDNGAKAETQVDRALTFLRVNQDRDAYVFMHLLDPHIFYGAPGGWRNKFVTTDSDLPSKINRWDVYKLMQQGKLSEDDKAYLQGLYDGEIAYTSYELGRFFHELDKMGGKTLVVVHSDHGEEFWEHGGFEHNHSLYDDTTRALLMVRPGPGFEGGRRVDVPVTLADIAPTLYDYAGFEPESLPPLDGRSLRPLIAGEAPGADWKRPISVGHLRYGHERWGVVHDDHKYVVHTGTGEEELYNLAEDRGEQKNLVGSGVDLAGVRNALADSHQMAVCDGLRITVDAQPRDEAFYFELPAPPLGVQILDPERAVEAPANQAWGLPPTRRPEEIGSIEWEPGSTRFTWKPGTRPRDGQIFVFYDSPVDPAAVKIFRPDTIAALQLKPQQGAWTWAERGSRLHLRRGLTLAPPPGEATRMRALQKLASGDASGSDLAMLAELGYLGDVEDEHGHGGPPSEGAPEPEAPEDTAAPEGEDGGEEAPLEPPPLRADTCRW